ncbi:MULTISPECIES: hypothetical protein [unclassified Arcicella]|uniref:hypothetical protein n=1 Tax=unclassified Arcicella TaxID=2644986 RepID=UPI00285D22C1|nr:MULTISPECIES: hypothetical protein [unclassified Arcicella]MDR6565007.1 hypothetical protein [Arcicella sp. BE51]MDR6814814.1 hypothetical protein [Arcicella sp. BE140]MDR6826260.1 hypothetical protein [Arcicella sp. BE139]
MKDFVTEYNRSASSLFIMDHDIKSSYAKVITNARINIEFGTKISRDNQSKIKIINQLYPSLFASAIKQSGLLNDLLNEGVEFNFVFFDDNYREFTNIVIDRKTIKELLKDSPNDKHSSEVSKNNNPKAAEIEQMLKVMNGNLPYVDPKTGNKVLRINLSDKNELVYEVEPAADLMVLLKSEDGKNLLKDEMMRNPNLKLLANNLKNTGILGIKYIYLNKKGKVINYIILDEKDLK